MRYDLSKIVRDPNGSPEMLPQQATLTGFDEPVEITYPVNGSTKTESFVAGVPKIRHLTYRALIMRALRADDQGKSPVDIDRKTELIGMIMGDEADLDDEAKGDIIKVVRAQGDPMHLYRLKEFFEHPEPAKTKPTKQSTK